MLSQFGQAYEARSNFAVTTYRYLRIGMVMAVVGLAASVLYERSKAPCWQTSISAYYYTPARAVFVSGLVVIGASLIMIKGSNLVEDILLNLAGILAPVVAFVPTEAVKVRSTGAVACVSSVPERIVRVDDAGEADTVARWVTANIGNNIFALFVVGLVAFALALVLSFVPDKVNGVNMGSPWSRHPDGVVVGLFVAAVVLFAGWVTYHEWDAFDTRAHGFAAVAMFGFLGLAVLCNAVEHRSTKRYLIPYAVIFLLMLTLGIYFQLISDSSHHVLIVEIIEIALFAAFWVTQTIQHWNETAGT